MADKVRCLEPNGDVNLAVLGPRRNEEGGDLKKTGSGGSTRPLVLCGMSGAGGVTSRSESRSKQPVGLVDIEGSNSKNLEATESSGTV